MSPGRQPRSASDQGSSQTSDPLREYRDKRKPLGTNEPFSTERESSVAATRSGRFVVHLHSARQRHYDLRLQVGRRLKSFAVPRGPSLDPGLRRLAILTEDHPLEYLEFEDVIPAGNYGAGPMIAWDVGRVVYLEGSAEEGLTAGKIDFVLSGFKLKGRFGLVQTRGADGKEWLLIKKSDGHERAEGDITVEAPQSVFSGLTVDELEHKSEVARQVAEAARQLGAQTRELPNPFEPMLCAETTAPLDDPERLYELKLDGVRIVARKSGGLVTLHYRNGRSCTHSYPEIVHALSKIPGERAVLDGEIIAFDAQGRPRFQRLGPRIQARTALDVARVAAETPVVYLTFDLLWLDGLDLTGLPLFERKRLLSQLLRGRGLVRALDHLQGHGQELFEFCRSGGLEGVVAKKRDSVYRFGPRRSDDWIKVKCEREADFVIVGLLPGKGSRAELGALVVASFEAGELRFRGRVGSGFDQRTLAELTETLRARRVKQPTVAPPLPEEAPKILWVAPALVARVRYLGFTDDARLRAPVFCGLRPDVTPESCTESPNLGLPVGSDEPPRASGVDQRTLGPVLREGLVISNRNKVFWPDDGYTKGDLIDYYASLSQVMLPFLAQRPVVLVRHPDGISGKNFFQWNVPRGTPSWIRTLSLQDPDEPDREKTVFLIDDRDTLLYIINLGAIPLHVLASRAVNLDHCDFITFDLDLNEQPFLRAVEIALSLREILTEVGLLGYPKTSGQGGLHILVPLGPGIPFAAAKLLVELLGRLVTQRHAEFATMERRVDKRGGRLYVDTGQTGTSRTIVAPYSVRARPFATVSTPLFWDELSGALEPSRFTMMTVPARLEEVGDPYSGLLDERPDIAGALAKIEHWVR